MKVTQCPVCDGDNLSDIWRPQRKLKQSCNDCLWNGGDRTPEMKVIETKKDISANHFWGFCFEIFDKYGHLRKGSRSYNTEKEAMDRLLIDIEDGKKDVYGGPYTAVLWPSTVNVVGKMFK